MRKLFLSALFLLPAGAIAAEPSTAPPAVSVTVPAIHVTVPTIHVKVTATSSAATQSEITESAVPEAEGTVAGPAHLVTASVPARGTKSLHLTVRVGSLRVTTGNTNTVKVRVQAVEGSSGHFIFTWRTHTGKPELPANLRLLMHRSGNTLQLCLGTDSCSGSETHVESVNGWAAHWDVVVPKRFHVKVDAGVVDARILGIRGGLDANIGVGKLEATLPSGPVSAKIGVGKLDVAVASPDYGAVDLATGVGDASFWVKGRKITDGFHREFTSSSQHTAGKGTTSYELKAGTGHVVLRLGTTRSAGASDDHG